ncbi:MAG: septation protein A [Gammaproteobacteria bacterium]|nr:septation protein A [Gammaproteobacteria bacterium]
MKFLYDFFPILLFFIAYKLEGIYTATVVAIVASCIQVGFYWFRHRRFENMHLISFGIILTMGTLTLLLHDKAFIMWKPTLINWLFAVAFFGSQFIGKKSLIQRMLGSQLKLPAPVWKRLNGLWIGFFLLSGAANLYFAQDYAAAERALLTAMPEIQQAQIDKLECESGYSDTTRNLCEVARDKEALWVNFKLFGLLGLTFIFIIGQAVYLTRYIEEDAEDKLSQKKSETNQEIS